MPTLDQYAPYIFSAYGVAIVALVGLVGWTVWRTRQAKKKLDAVEKEQSQAKEQAT
jgi:heme exporter protein CcmD